MANEKHLKIIKQGAKAWNEWREDPEPRLDLSGADLRGVKLRNADLSRVNLRGAYLRWADLSNADLRDADLRNVDLSDAIVSCAKINSANLSSATLSGAKLSDADLRDANLSEADLKGADLSNADLSHANLSRATLRGAYLGNVDLSDADLSNADLSDADLRDAILISTKLSDAALSRADLVTADLSRADLSRANLSGADLNRANLSRANLSGADLNRADLSRSYLGRSYLTDADLSDADLTDADLSDALIGGTIFGDNNLCSVKGLESLVHRGPSTIGVNTLNESRGDIPDVFLRGCGLRDWEIEAAKLHCPDLKNDEINTILYEIYHLRVYQAIQVNPIFISYNHKDCLFVDKLEQYLNDKGIRFWRDVHHATAGRLEKQVDHFMRINPTVLVILSSNSVESDWVEHEVRLARKLEKELNHDVICPVALDDSWKTCSWPERLREQIMEYKILDFSGWTDESFFNRTFTKLIDGLDLFYK